MANTPHGYPYPLGTDRVMDGDDVIRALATAIDAQLGVIASGLASVPTPTTGVVVTQVVNLPAGRFNAAPNIQATIQAANPQNWAPVGISNVSATSFTLNVFRTAGGTTNTFIYWVAHLI